MYVRVAVLEDVYLPLAEDLEQTEVTSLSQSTPMPSIRRVPIHNLTFAAHINYRALYALRRGLQFDQVKSLQIREMTYFNDILQITNIFGKHAEGIRLANTHCDDSENLDLSGSLWS